ncbi:transposase, MuDR, MULE transposase domain protein [Tanacetum coccineum]
MDKVTLPDGFSDFIKMQDPPEYRFPWGYRNIVVDREFWLVLACLDNIKQGWLKDSHLDLWIDLMWYFREPDADWVMVSPHFSICTLGGSMIDYYSNGVRYPVAWQDVEKVYFLVNEPKKHWCLAELHISTGVSKGIAVETYEIKYMFPKVVRQADDYGDCGVWVSRIGGLMSYVDLVKVFKTWPVVLDNDVTDIMDVTRVYRPKDIAHDVNMEWNIYVSYKKAWKGKHIALASSQGCPIELFAQLPFYCYNLKKENKGTVTYIETDDKGRFKMCFIGFGVAIDKPSKTIGTYLGTNLVAVGMDGNNQIIPIAIGVSQGETDRHYAITLACNTIFENSFHGYFCRHLMTNCGMQSDKFKELYWKTCKAYTPEDFEKLMSDIHALRLDAHQKQVDVGIKNGLGQSALQIDTNI